ncbi:TMEM175 family protein [soil metagenome]
MSNLISSPARLEAFSDGVIAVIITIMVLELKVPHENGLAGLRAVLPTLGVYALSFSFTGVYWINHHYLVHRTEETDQSILFANLAFLFTLSLLPYFTSYLLDKKMDTFSVLLYIISMMAIGFSFLLLRLAIGRRLRRRGALELDDKAAEYKHLASLALYGVSLFLAFSHPNYALGIVALVMVIWIYPTAPTSLRPSRHPHLHPDL